MEPSNSPSPFGLPNANVVNNQSEKSKRAGLPFSIGAFACAFVALGFVPLLFGIVGIYLGYKSRQKGEKTLGMVAIVVSFVAMLIGMALGVLIRLKTQQ